MVVARRVYVYLIAFASLWMVVFGVFDLLQVALETVAEAMLGPVTTVGPGNLTDRVSFASSMTGIGLVTWVIHWLLAARAVRRDGPLEQRSAIRKLYLYAVLLVGGLILTFTFRTLFADLLEAAFGLLRRSDVLSGSIVEPVAGLIAVGASWAYHARVVARDRAAVPEADAGATLRRWCVYILAFVGLMMLLFGTAGLVTRLVELTLPTDAQSADSGRWLAVDVSGRVASVVAGLLLWLAGWGWSTREFNRQATDDPERDSVLRKVYLYLALLVVVSWTVWNVGQVLYVVIRSFLLPGEAGELWASVQSELGQTIANTLVFGLAWAYHATVVRREAAAARELHRQATIRWLYGYLVALVGLAILSTGVGGTLATLLDLTFDLGDTTSGWWQERLSLFTTLIVVGLPVWLIPWLRLQREVVARVARRSLARRVYLFLILGLAVLTLLGSGAFTLYQLLRAALGEGWSASDTSSLIDAASAALVAALLLAYHVRVFQRDAALAQEDAEGEPGPLAPAAPPTTGEPVTLLVVRAADVAEADTLRERLSAALPAGTTVQTVQVAAADAARLLPPPNDH